MYIKYPCVCGNAPVHHCGASFLQGETTFALILPWRWFDDILTIVPVLVLDNYLGPMQAKWWAMCFHSYLQYRDFIKGFDIHLHGNVK